MKKITIMIFLMTFSLGFAQQQEYLLDFEPGTPSGDVDNWLTFEGDDIDPPQIIDNPDTDGGTVPVTKVLKVTAPAGGNFFDGVNNTFDDLAFGTWKLDAAVPSNGTFSMDVNKNYVGTIGIKMGTVTQGTVFEITDQNVNNDVIDEWQTLTWTIDVAGIPPTLETDISQIVIFIDWTQGQPDRDEPAVLHIDNITFNAEQLTEPVDGGTNPPSGPASAAPTPSENAEDVYSLFSNAYNNNAVDTWLTPWSNAQLEDLQIEGVDTKRYFNLDFAGVEMFGTPVDASEYDFFHIDVWSSNVDLFRVKLVNFNGNDFDNEGEIAFDIAQGEWVSLEIPLADFADADLVTDDQNLLINRDAIKQLIFSGTPTGALDVYVDNVYFSKESLSSSQFEDEIGFAMYPNPTRSQVNFSAKSPIESVQIHSVAGKQILSANNHTDSLDISHLKSGVYLVSIVVENTKLVKKLVIQ